MCKFVSSAQTFLEMGETGDTGGELKSRSSQTFNCSSYQTVDPRNHQQPNLQYLRCVPAVSTTIP